MKNNRIYNFGAGPATLPEPVLLEAQAELLNWQELGVSVLEVGHRTDAFKSLMAQAEADLRELIGIPDNYRVLFLGGAARMQFAMVPMNLLPQGQQAGYLISGLWSSQAFDEACKLGDAYCIASSKSTPDPVSWTLHENTAYVYYTPNETINGVRFAQVPKVGNIPLIADMTSCLLSEPVNVGDFGLIFAGAQKNISIAGLTLVIIRNDLLARIPAHVIPTMLDYRIHVAHDSLYATPPIFNCYLAAKMFQWLKMQGGVEAIYKLNCLKAAKLYDYIDQSSFYHCAVEKHARSIMNVCFSLQNSKLEDEFVAQAAQHGLYALKGHRVVGGLRASLYNAMPMAGVKSLIAFMRDFSKENQS